MDFEKGHIPSLDGIRAVAVLLVFFSHIGLGHIVPGGLGVTIFFFLSGYLITTLLLKEKNNTKTINLKSFYIRRVYRLFPPLYIVLFSSFLFGVIYGGISKLTLQATLSQLLHFSNYQIIYFGENGFLPGMGILWSLAVEEHFYLFFPVIFLLTVKSASRKKLIIFIIFAIIIVNFWRLFLVFQLDILNFGNPSYLYTYYASEARVDSILYGVLMALTFNPIEKNKVAVTPNTIVVLCTLAVLLLLFTLIWRNAEFRETLRYTLQGVALFPIFYAAVKYPNHPIFKILNVSAIRFIGQISYCFYLCHYLFIDLAVNIWGDSFVSRAIGGFMLSIAFSSLIYFAVERKFYMLRKKLHN